MAKTAKPEPDPGLVVVDKPAGWTSHDVVGRMRRLASTRKVGHAGTLDPMATGVLVLGIGRGTRLLTYVVGADKDYTATIRLGQATVTDDAEGDVTATADASGVSEQQIADAVTALTGEIQQVPSTVSAIKVDGQRAYARARQGEDVELAARPVTVSRFEVLAVRRADALIDLDVEVTVSSGTYVRALARDLGRALGVGGHLTALRRTRVGGFTLDSAHSLDFLGDLVDEGGDVPRLPLGEAAAAVMPVVTLDARGATALGYGQRIGAPEDAPPGPMAALSETGDLIAVVERAGDRLKPEVVFQPVR